MDVREIKKLIGLMNENGLSRLEVEEEGKRYLLEKGGMIGSFPPPTMYAAPAAPALAAPTPSEGSPKPIRKAAEDTVTFNSPMVGTFFRAASPEAEPFVSPGDRVEPTTVLCLIEAMKVFNEVRAEMSGTVVEILADSGEAVEYNQPLFLIKRA